MAGNNLQLADECTKIPNCKGFTYYEGGGFLVSEFGPTTVKKENWSIYKRR